MTQDNINIRSLQDDKILSKLEGQEEYKLYKEMLYLRSQLISPPPMTVPFISIEVVNRQTGRIEDKQESLTHTWLRNYHNKFAAMICGLQATGTGSFEAGELNVKRTNGAINSDVIFGAVEAAFGDSDVGITIGRGPAAYDFEDFVLDNPIAHGTGVNEMEHYDMFNSEQSWVGGGTRQWTSVTKRYFVNRSGGSIAITEVGYGDDQVLLSRDVLAPSVAIANLKAAKVTYTFVSGVWAS